MKPMTQGQEIILHMHRHGFITRAAAAGLHIYELSSRLGELESKGWQFDREKISGTTHGGRRWHCVRYSNARMVA